MIDLFKKYISLGDDTNALLVGQNLFNKNKGNKEIFSLYFSLLLKVANTKHDKAEKAVEQMVTALSVYSENADLNEAEVNYIRDCESKITAIVNALEEEAEAKKVQFLKEAISQNDVLLSKAKTKLAELSGASNRESFNDVLKEIYDLDNEFDKENFVSRQKNEYEEITAKCQKVVDTRLKEFDRLDNVQYNLKAIDSYERIFKLFSEPKKANYSTTTIAELFSYDASRLTNETLVYYNHVYNFVLSKLNDDEKLLLTKAAIKAEKKG